MFPGVGSARGVEGEDSEGAEVDVDALRVGGGGGRGVAVRRGDARQFARGEFPFPDFLPRRGLVTGDDKGFLPDDRRVEDAASDNHGRPDPVAELRLPEHLGLEGELGGKRLGPARDAAAVDPAELRPVAGAGVRGGGEQVRNDDGEDGETGGGAIHGNRFKQTGGPTAMAEIGQGRAGQT